MLKQLVNSEKKLALVSDWLSLHLQDRGLSAYFRNRGIKKVVIYGVAKLGQLLYQDLSKLDNIEVIGFADRTASGNRICCGLPVYLPEELEKLEDLDMIVVSAIVSYEAIEKSMVRILPEKPLVSLETIIKECSIED